MIDIHSHILPCLDDGPTCLEESLELAQAAVLEGITTIIATPHCIPEVYNNEKAAVLEVVGRFQSELDIRGIPLQILPGMEVHVALDVPKKLTGGNALTLCDGGKYILLEFPLSCVPNYSEQVIFEIMLKGFKPILAHPERNKEILDNPFILQRFIEKGCLVQITSGSLTGQFGSSIEGFTRQLLQSGWVDFMATDAHHSKKRPPQLKQAWKVARDLIGEARANELVLDNPRRIICGEGFTKGEISPLQRPKPSIRQKKLGFWSRLGSFFR